jgi:uncharacterized membrane protein YccC
MRMRNTMGNRYSGTLGKDTVASCWKGIRYLREYKIPMDPKSELQLQHRALFAKAVEIWHALDPRRQDEYNKAAVRMTGYNLFIRQYIEAVRNGREPEIMQMPEEKPQSGDKRDQETSKDIQEDTADCPDTLSAIFE